MGMRLSRMGGVELLGTLSYVCCSSFLIIAFAGCPAGGNVGTTTCLACHDGRSAPDQRVHTRGAHAAIACESCHGPGQLHVRSGGRAGLFINNPANQSFAKAVGLCAECHKDKADGFKLTRHGSLEVAACHDCHDVHQPNGLAVPLGSTGLLTQAGYQVVCQECHATELDAYAQSGHGTKTSFTCYTCHDMHIEDTLVAPVEDNTMCSRCHNFIDLISEAAIDTHTGFMHSVDPAGSGASRCVGCHMPPVPIGGGDTTADHTFATIPPSRTVAALDAGVTPVPANSCAGVAGCHDIGVPGSGAVHRVTDRATNEQLQVFYENNIGQIP